MAGMDQKHRISKYRFEQAQDRLFNLAQNPDIVNRVLGLFDPDFN